MERYHQYEAVANLLKKLSHPVRICIVLGLHRQGQVNVNAMICELNMPQSTVSTHLSILREAGVVETVRQGSEVYYRLADSRWVEIFKILEV